MERTRCGCHTGSSTELPCSHLPSFAKCWQMSCYLFSYLMPLKHRLFWDRLTVLHDREWIVALMNFNQDHKICKLEVL